MMSLRYMQNRVCFPINESYQLKNASKMLLVILICTYDDHYHINKKKNEEAPH